MVYIDTSALVPLFIREPKSEAVVQWLESSGQPAIVSEWALLEFASAMSAKVRARKLTEREARDAMSRAEAFAVQQHGPATVPGQDEFRQARELTARHGMKVRGGDALHIAICLAVKAQAMLCLDRIMIDAGRAIGLNVLTV